MRGPDRRYPTPRTSPARKVPIGWISAILCVVLIGILFAFGWAIAKQVNERAAGSSTKDDSSLSQYMRHDALTVNYTTDGERVTWYVMTDPESGKQYLFNNLGGVTPRLDRDGNQVEVGTINDD